VRCDIESRIGGTATYSKQEVIMSRSLVLVAALLCATGGTSMAQDTATNAQSATSAQSNAAAKEFVEQAGTSGLAEVEMGEIGAKKASNSQVKAFAKRIVADHTKANEELLTAIKGKGVQVPSSRTSMHKATVEKFQQQDSGKNFDRDYMEQMVEDHKADVELFETAADNEQLDLDLRSYAKRTLPTLREHLKEAQTIQSKLAN
jgi:putative membrane protein